MPANAYPSCPVVIHPTYMQAPTPAPLVIENYGASSPIPRIGKTSGEPRQSTPIKIGPAKTAPPSKAEGGGMGTSGWVLAGGVLVVLGFAAWKLWPRQGR